MLQDAYYFQGIRDNNSKVIKRFMDENRPKIIALVRKRDSRNKIHPDDVFLDALSVVIRKIRTGTITEETMSARLSTYLYAVADNKCKDLVKSAHYRLADYQEDDAVFDSMWEDPRESEEIDEALYIVELAKKIKPPCNEMLMEYYVHRLTYEEIAERHGYKNYNSAKKKNGECLKKARQLVREDPYFKAKYFGHA